MSEPRRGTNVQLRNGHRKRFIEALTLCPNVKAAAIAAGVDRRTVYRARESDPEFAAEWDDAIGASVDRLEAAAFQRAEETSDVLAIFLLKSHKPELYRDRVDINFIRRIAADLEQMTDEQLDEIAPAASGPVRRDYEENGAPGDPSTSAGESG